MSNEQEPVVDPDQDADDDDDEPVPSNAALMTAEAAEALIPKDIA